MSSLEISSVLLKKKVKTILEYYWINAMNNCFPLIFFDYNTLQDSCLKHFTLIVNI